MSEEPWKLFAKYLWEILGQVARDDAKKYDCREILADDRFSDHYLNDPLFNNAVNAGMKPLDLVKLLLDDRHKLIEQSIHYARQAAPYLAKNDSDKTKRIAELESRLATIEQTKVELAKQLDDMHDRVEAAEADMSRARHLLGEALRVLEVQG